MAGQRRPAGAGLLRPRYRRWHIAVQSWAIEVDGLTVVVDTGVGNDRQRPHMPSLGHLHVSPIEEAAQLVGWSDAYALIERRGPDDQIADVLIAAMQHMLADALAEEVDGGLAAVRLFLAETQLAEALHRAYSDTLDAATAEQLRAAVERAIGIAVDGVRSSS